MVISFFQPISLADVLETIKENGIKCSVVQLKNFFDEQVCKTICVHVKQITYYYLNLKDCLNFIPNYFQLFIKQNLIYSTLQEIEFQ